jgi:Skp1 family, dimerisation domain
MTTLIKIVSSTRPPTTKFFSIDSILISGMYNLVYAFSTGGVTMVNISKEMYALYLTLLESARDELIEDFGTTTDHARGKELLQRYSASFWNLKCIFSSLEHCYIRTQQVASLDTVAERVFNTSPELTVHGERFWSPALVPAGEKYPRGEQLLVSGFQFMDYNSGILIPIDHPIVDHSSVLRGLLAAHVRYLRPSSESTTVVYPGKCTPKVLATAMAYAEHYAQPNTPYPEIPKPLRSPNMAENVPAFDAELLQRLGQEELFEMVILCNMLDYRPMMDLACACVASMIKGKTPEQIRETFNIRNDFTPEEEARVRAENQWALDEL